MKQLLFLLMFLGGTHCYAQYGTTAPNKTPVKTGSYTDAQGISHDTYTGPRGGVYYFDEKGVKKYPSREKSEVPSDAIIETGPRGGHYYIKNGKKTYIPKKKN